MEVCPHCRNSFKQRGGLSLNFTWSSECRKVWQRTQHQDERLLFDNDANTGEAEQCWHSPSVTTPTPPVFETRPEQLAQPEVPTHHESFDEDCCYHDTSTTHDNKCGQLGVLSDSIKINELFLQVEYGCTEQMWSFLPSTMEANDRFTTNTVNNAAPGFPIRNIATNAALPMDDRSDTSSHSNDDNDPWFEIDCYTVDKVVQIDLIHTIRTLKVPLKTYNAVMGWAH